jgi:hypothetical protein
MARPSLIPPNIPGHVYSLTQRVRFLEQHCQFGMYYRASGAINVNETAADENDIQSYWLATIVPLLRPCLSVGTTIDEVRIWSLVWPNVGTGIFSMGGQLGTVAGDPLPPQIAMVLTKRTALRGKSGRGRMYLCGFSEDSSTNGRPTVAVQAACNAFASALKNPFVGASGGKTFTPVVVSLKQYAIDSVEVDNPGPPPTFKPKPPPIQFPKGGDITSVIADDVWFTQRRRTIGRGE